MEGFFNIFDYLVFVIYLSVLIAISIALKNKASGSLEDYFLGGRNLPWWLMGLSGMATFLSLAGTMVVISFLYMLGPRGLYVAFRGGACIPLAVMLIWSGKWHRRSGCITVAEFMKFRFGTDLAGQVSRVVTAIVRFIFTIGLISLISKGVGIFLAIFLPYSPLVCSLVFIIVVTVYTIFSGFYGVVITDFIQMLILLLGIGFICFAAIQKIIIAGDDFQTIVTSVTGNQNWFSSLPPIKAELPTGYEMYEYLLWFASFALINTVVFGTPNGGEYPQQFACKTDKDCSKMTGLWMASLSLRWPFMIAFVVLGIILVNDLFADLTLNTQAVELIKSQVPGTTSVTWSDMINSIAINPDSYPDVTASLKNLLGPSWQENIRLLDYHGNINGETILPAVFKHFVPAGMRGVLLIGLIAASMSSFDSAVNAAAGLFTRDIYQNIIRPKAGMKELIYVTYLFIIVVVVLGFLMAFTVKSVDDIWSWIIMGLITGLVIPSTLRYFWWRFNAWGFNAGILFGTFIAVIQRLAFPELDVKIAYIILLISTMTVSVCVTLLTPPTDPKTVETFFLKVRPFGLWKPFKDRLTEQSRVNANSEHRRDLIALPFSVVAHISLMLCSVQAVLMLWKSVVVTFGIFVGCVIMLYYSWYRHLDKMDYEMSYSDEIE
jgi:Na+/proline symporter